MIPAMEHAGILTQFQQGGGSLLFESAPLDTQPCLQTSLTTNTMQLLKCAHPYHSSQSQLHAVDKSI